MEKCEDCVYEGEGGGRKVGFGEAFRMVIGD